MADKELKKYVLCLIEKSPKKLYTRKKSKKNHPHNLTFTTTVPRFKKPDWMNRDFFYIDFQAESGPCVGEILKCFIDEIESRLSCNLNVCSVYKCCSPYRNRASILLESFIFRSQSYSEDDIRRIISKESSAVIAAAILLYLNLFKHKPLHFTKVFLNRLLSVPLYNKDLIPNLKLKEIVVDITIRQDVATVDTLTFVVAHINNILMCSTNPPLMQITLADIFGPALISFCHKPAVEEMPEKKPEALVLLAILELCNIDFWRRLNKALNRGDHESQEDSEKEDSPVVQDDQTEMLESKPLPVNADVPNDEEVSCVGDQQKDQKEQRDKRTYDNSYNMLWNSRNNANKEKFELPVKEKARSQALATFFEVNKKAKSPKGKETFNQSDILSKNSSNNDKVLPAKPPVTNNRFKGLIHAEVAAEMARRKLLRNRVPKFATVGSSFFPKKNIKENMNKHNSTRPKPYPEKSGIQMGFSKHTVTPELSIKTSETATPTKLSSKNVSNKNVVKRKLISPGANKNSRINAGYRTMRKKMEVKPTMKTDDLQSSIWTTPLGKKRTTK